MNFDDNTTKIILGILGLLAAAALISVTVKIVRKRNSDNKTTINQNKNTVTNGDIVGGDKTTNH